MVPYVCGSSHRESLQRRACVTQLTVVLAPPLMLLVLLGARFRSSIYHLLLHVACLVAVVTMDEKLDDVDF